MTPPSTTTPAPSTTQFHHSLRPWLTDFLSISSLSLPISFTSLSHRIHRNLHTFRSNYLLISLLIFLLTLIPRPITFIFFLLTSAAWIYLVLFRNEPLVVFDFEIGLRLVVIVLAVVTVGAVVVTGVWWNVFVAVVVAVVVVCLHASLRTPDDVEESPYGALLSVVDEDEPGRGPYTLV